MRKTILVSAIVAAAAASVIAAPAANADCVGGADTAGAKVCVDESSGTGRYTWFRATSPVLPVLEYPVSVGLSSYESNGVRSWSISDGMFVHVEQSHYEGTPYDGTNTGTVFVNQHHDDDSCELNIWLGESVDCGPARVPFLEIPTLP